MILLATAWALEPHIGTWQYVHDVGMVGEDPARCVADGGKWQEPLCVIGGAVDEVTVASSLKVTIATIATNAHTCTFEATARLERPLVLVAEAPADAAGASCTVRIEAADASWSAVKVSTDDDACRYYCGARASLHIARASRK